MADTTVIALAILGGVFIILIAALFKQGVDGAIKLWNVMGALTGVGFGSIITYYFADQKHQTEIANLQTQVSAAQSALMDAGNTVRELELFAEQLRHTEAVTRDDVQVLATQFGTVTREIERTHDILAYIDPTRLRVDAREAVAPGAVSQ